MIINKYNQPIKYISTNLYSQTIELLAPLNLIIEHRDRDLTHFCSNPVVKTHYEIATSLQYVIPESLIAVLLPYGFAILCANNNYKWHKLYLKT